MAISSLISISQLQKSAENTVTKGNLELAKSAARDVSNHLENIITDLKSIAGNLSEISLGKEQMDRLLKNAYLDFKVFQFIRFYNKDGALIATSELIPPQDKMNFEKMLPQLNKGDHYLSDIIIIKSPPPVRPAITVALPIIRLGELQQVVVAEVNLVYLWHLVSRIRITPNTVVSLVSSTGDIIASSSLALVFEINKHPGFKFFADALKENQSLVYTSPSNEEFLHVSARLEKVLDTYHIIIEEPSREAFRSIRQQKTQLAIIGLFIFLLMMGTGYVGLRLQVISKLNILVNGIKNIAAGKWNYKVQIDTKDEFKQLADSLNMMTDTLTSQAEEIRRGERLAFIGRMAGGLAHDLKHPVTNIRNWSRLLSTKHDDPEFREGFTRVVEREFTNIDTFFANLKELSSELTINRESMLVKSVFDTLISRFGITAKEKGLSLVCRLEPPDLVINADSFALERILSNLVSNAIEATPYQGFVTLEAKKNVDNNSTTVLFVITDTGHGMSEEQKQNLFKDFATTKRKGLGLGLAIVMRLTKAHGGRIDVASTPGKGTCFTLAFPQNS